jgi:hypothetical protein
MNVWLRVLDALEADAEALEAGQVVEWAPPGGLPPLPAELRERADAVLARLHAAEAHLVGERDRLQQQLDDLRASGSPGAPHAQFFDQPL